jgi:hypothetical protein
MAKEAFVIETADGRIADRLQKLWRKRKGTDPDVNMIREEIDKAQTPGATESEWFDKARDALGL